MNRTISSAILVAYAQCPLKAFQLMCTNRLGTPHEYEQILDQQRQANQRKYLEILQQKNSNVEPYCIDNLGSSGDFLINATLKADSLQAECAVLTKVGKLSFEPTIFLGTHNVTQADKLKLLFVGHVLAHIQGIPPVEGRIISVAGKSHKIALENGQKSLLPLLEPLQEWATAVSVEPPPVILNKHCPQCQFRALCQAQAKQEDNLSLLNRVTPKVIRQYEKKGIFTVKQLSHLFRPRKRSKRAKNPPPATHKIELQALAIRTGKIYLSELPALVRQPTELYLDIEGTPDLQSYYLIGLLICQGEVGTHLSFWADTVDDEADMWKQFLAAAIQYPDAPIYHYGSYEPRAIAKLTQRYSTNCGSLTTRLVNVNQAIFGKVYFPVYSNRLKDIGNYIGARWTSPDASGLQSLVWRHHWEETGHAQYKEWLLTYNAEDCSALKLLIEELSKIKLSADTLSEVDFADKRKKQTTQISTEVHSQFETILRFAHMNYDRKKICFRQDENKNSEIVERKKRGIKKGYQGQRKVRPRTTKVAQVPSESICPKCIMPLQPTKKRVTRQIMDLVLTKSGIRKTVTEYVSTKGYCSKCSTLHNPPGIAKYGHSQLYGHGFKAWFIYHRVAMRLPYESMSEMMEEQHGEKILAGSIVTFIKDFAQYYAETEKSIIQSLLKSPVIHADETKVNIKGANWYGWVFANDKYIVFKLSETREAVIAQEFLADFKGILVSDFYAGYDSIPCKQQKCWVHLIRDLNDDLRENSFDTEYEAFVLKVRDLIIPIMETVQRHGLKRRNLGKFRKEVNKFYDNVIIDKRYRSDLTLKYQKRFLRYRESLFTFLEQDGIPWNNNAAERGIRHLAIQRDISTPFHESAALSYLVLLGIRQTCRFQGKSFFKFLFSGETKLDKFDARKRKQSVQ